MDNRGQSVFGSVGSPDADIDAPEAWEITTGSREVTVGVLDTGIDYTHPDLAENVWINQGEIPPSIATALQDIDQDGLITFADLNSRRADGQAINQGAGKILDLNGNGFIDGGDLLQALNNGGWEDGVDNDGNGKTDDLIGWDFVNNDNDPMDDQGHGTYVSGTIGAVGHNGIGVTGVNWVSSLMPLKVLDADRTGANSDVVAALNYVSMMRGLLDVNVRLTNNSYVHQTPNTFSNEVFSAVEDHLVRGILFVAAACNGDLNGGIDLDKSQFQFYPASYNLDNVISVAATNNRDELWTGSNFGITSVDIGAPGVGIVSTERAGGYAVRNGTSMAAPYVSGVAALVWSRFPEATVDEVRGAILQSVDSIPSLKDRVASGGRVNAWKALNAPTFAPEASLRRPADIATKSRAAVALQVTYSDREGLDGTTFDDSDIIVRRVGFSNDDIGATLSEDAPSSGKRVTVVYEIAPPEGSWDAVDNGTYEIVLRASQVADVEGVTSTEQLLATFEVSIPDPTVFMVNSRSDAPDSVPGDGIADADPLAGQRVTTLRAAIMEANAMPGHNTILLPSGTYTLSVEGDDDLSARGDLDVLDSLTIIGGGRETTVINSSVTGRLFHFNVPDNRFIENGPSDAAVVIDGVTIAGGSATTGGGIRHDQGNLYIRRSAITENTADDEGGGIYNEGDLTLVDSLISINRVANQLGVGGGGIFNGGTLTVSTSTIVGNSSNSSGFHQTNVGGGGLFNDAESTVTIVNSTISGNEAIASSGGGIYSRGTLTILNSTVTTNRASTNGGGISVVGDTKIQNTIVANNSADSDDDVSGPFTSRGGNLIGDTGRATGFGNGDQLGDRSMRG